MIFIRRYHLQSLEAIYKEPITFWQTSVVESFTILTPLLFQACGFLSAFSFTAKLREQGKKKATIMDCLQFLRLRLIRLVPIYLICFFYALFVQKHMSMGPMMFLFDEVLQPCFDGTGWLNHLFLLANFPGTIGSMKEAIDDFEFPDKIVTIREFSFLSGHNEK